MGVGKLAAQVGHATLGVYRLAQRSEDVSNGFCIISFVKVVDLLSLFQVSPSLW